MNYSSRHPTHLLQLLLKSRDWLESGLSAGLKASGWQGVPVSQALLLSLVGGGERRPSEIARRLGVSRQAVHQTLAEMEAAKWLALEPDPFDKRAKCVALTESGTQLLAAVASVFTQIEGTLERRLGSSMWHGMLGALEADWGPAPKADGSPE